METDRRNYGIDLLRSVAMLGIVVLHILYHGGILNAVGLDLTKFSIIWLIEILAYSAVDCFALISGYTGYKDIETPYRYWKYMPIYLQVFVYSFGIAVVTSFFQEVQFKDIIKAAMPVTTTRYWYFTAYTGVFFMAPWANRFIRNLTRNEAKHLAILFFLLLFYLPIAGQFADPFKIVGGYSFLWLFVLYLVGAFIKKFNIGKNVNIGLLLAVQMSFLVITLVSEIVMKEYNFLCEYTSVTIVGMACIELIVFSKLKIMGKIANFLKAITPSIFGVYLIHDNPIFRQIFIENNFIWIVHKPVYTIWFWIVGIAVLVMFSCLIIDKFRELLFKLLRINSLAKIIDQRIRIVLEQVVYKQ